jgi:hypothetical protein
MTFCKIYPLYSIFSCASYALAIILNPFPASAQYLDDLKILTTQKLYGNKIEVAVRYPYEPGYDAIVVVIIDCNKMNTSERTAMSPGLVKEIASRVCRQ